MNPSPVDAAHGGAGPSAVRLTFDERLARLRRRRRSARVAVQVLSWVTAGLGFALLAVLIESGH